LIGRYKLLEKIGEGGVWHSVCGRAARAALSGRVAFKIIKLGMDTKQVIARFEAERTGAGADGTSEYCQGLRSAARPKPAGHIAPVRLIFLKDPGFVCCDQGKTLYGKRTPIVMNSFRPAGASFERLKDWGDQEGWHPRDAMVAAPATGVFRLIGFIGRQGREPEAGGVPRGGCVRIWPTTGGSRRSTPSPWRRSGGSTRPSDLIERSMAANPRNATAPTSRRTCSTSVARIASRWTISTPGCPPIHVTG